MCCTYRNSSFTKSADPDVSKLLIKTHRVSAPTCLDKMYVSKQLSRHLDYIILLNKLPCYVHIFFQILDFKIKKNIFDSHFVYFINCTVVIKGKWLMI